jgi:hypothetical protein
MTVPPCARISQAHFNLADAVNQVICAFKICNAINKENGFSIIHAPISI